MSIKTLAAAAVTAMALAAPAYAQMTTQTTTTETRNFAPAEREMITKYYTTNRSTLVPGTTTTVTQVQRGQALPTTVTRTALPAELISQLPKGEYERVLVGNNVVLLDRNGMVIDVLPLGG